MELKDLVVFTRKQIIYILLKKVVDPGKKNQGIVWVTHELVVVMAGFLWVICSSKREMNFILSNYGITQEKKTFRDFGAANRLLQRKQIFGLSECRINSGKNSISLKHFPKMQLWFHQNSEIMKNLAILLIKCMKFLGK